MTRVPQAPLRLLAKRVGAGPLSVRVRGPGWSPEGGHLSRSLLPGFWVWRSPRLLPGTPFPSREPLTRVAGSVAHSVQI